MAYPAVRPRGAVQVTFIMLLSAALAGCGTVFPQPGGVDVAAVLAARESACDQAPAPADADTLVVIDWDGGVSALLPDRQLQAFDFGALTITDADSIDADAAVLFRQAVLARVQTMLCALAPLDVAVIAGQGEEYSGATVVHVTGEAPPYAGKQIGQSDYDPCNEHPDDASVIWGGALATRIDSATFAGWVNAFANTIAHEIGHTLGFTHPNEETVGRLLPEPAQELMRGTTTAADLVTVKAFLIEQNTCPADATGEMSYHLTD